MVDKLSIRPQMSMVATLLISAGAAMLMKGDYFGLVLIITGCALYLFKAKLYKDGFFFEEDANDVKEEGE